MANLFHAHITSLPGLIEELLPAFELEAARAFDDSACRRIERLHVTGCGDSHHAALACELAFEQLAGVPCEPHTSMQFARYAAPWLPGMRTGAALIAVSVSGGVSRTIEGVLRANKAGIDTWAVTSSANTPIGQAAQHVLVTRVPDLPTALGVQVPGARSFFASLLMLHSVALRLAAVRDPAAAADGRRALHALPALMRRTLAALDDAAQDAARATRDAHEFVFCGGGPNYAVALFSAAKVLEASGDSAVGQDIEEWAHLQYFARRPDTPTFLISLDERADASRAREVETAMRAIGRRVVRFDFASALGPAAAALPEWLAPFVTALPHMLFAAHRAELIGEEYFRAFGGGRSVEGGGGISRIRTSEIVA